jgi:small conductance mechanosensitive channel
MGATTSSPSPSPIPLDSDRVGNAGLGESVLVLALAIGAALFAYHFSSVIPPYLSVTFYVILSLVGGYFVIRFFSEIIDRALHPTIGITRSHAVKNLFQIVASIVLVIILASFFKFNLTNWLVGAGFIGIVLGLAAQQIIGNLFAGVALLSSQPFDIGDRLTLITSGYGIIGMTFPHENLMNGYTGVVQDIGIFYTRMMTDEGVPLIIPNSVVIGSLLMNHSKVRTRTVRVRMDLDKSTSFDEFRAEMQSRLEESGSDLIEPNTTHVDIVEIGTSTYQVVVWLWTRSVYEEPVKTVIVEKALEVQRRLAAESASEKRSSSTDCTERAPKR